MSYLVIARKYRPLLFRDVVGQEHITRTLANAIKTNHIAQGYIFTGTRGVGKTTTARIFAKALNCEKGLNPEPCNVCPSCISITDGQNVDVFEIDGASNRGINEIRELRATIKFKPMIGRYKIYIIDEVHMITNEGFNALLKTLEEPPEHAIFIFATTDLHKVPETILSRCQVYNFRKISLDEITTALKEILIKEKIEFEDDAVLEIAKLGDGSLRDSESLLDQTLSFSSKKLALQTVREVLGITPCQLLYDLTNHIFELQKKEAFDIITQIINAGYDLNQFIKDYIQFFRDLLVQKNIKTKIIGLKIEQTEQLTIIAQKTSSNKIIMLIEELLNLLRELKTTTFTTVLVEMTLFKMFKIIETVDIEEINNHIKKLNLLMSSAPEKLAVERRLETRENQTHQISEKKTVDRLDEINNIHKIENANTQNINQRSKQKTTVNTEKSTGTISPEITENPTLKKVLEIFDGKLIGVKKI